MAWYAIDAVTLLHLVEQDLSPGDGHRLVAPDSIRSQVMERLLADVRQGTRRDADALRLHERMTGLKLRLLGDRVSRTVAWRLAREHDGMTLRQAECLAIARLQAEALVTMDETLAALATGVVPLAGLPQLLAPAPEG